MMNKFKTGITVSTLVLAVLSGCAMPAAKQTADLYANSEKEVARQVAEEKTSKFNSESTGTATKVARAYNGSKSIPLKSSPVLPEQFNQLKHFGFPFRNFTILEAAQKISEVSGIQVRVAQDVLKDPSAKQAQITLNTTATTAGILDQTAAVDGLSWEYKDGVVYISKYVTKTYRIKAVFGSRKHTYRAGAQGNTQASANTPGQSGGSIQSGFTSQTDIEAKSDINPIESLAKVVDSVLTKPVGGGGGGGKVLITGTNSLVVTDTEEGQRRAAEIIERENEIYTRNVTYRVQVFSLSDEKNNEASLDVQGLIQEATKYGVTISSSQTLASSSAGTIGYTVLSGGTPGKFDGSKAVAALLATQGTTATVHDINVPTRNLVSTPVNLTTQIPYLASTSAAPSSSGGTTGGTVGMTLGTAVTGFKMDFTSNIFDSNTISLQLAIGLVDLLEIRKVSAGANIGSLEAPVTSGFELAPELFLKPYETTLITGYERTSRKSNRSGLGQEWPLALGGGSVTASGKKEKLFILITPTIVSNAY